MKKLFFCACAGALALTACNGGAGSATLETEQDSVSYALGSVVAQSMMQQCKQFPFDTVNVRLMAAAFADSKPSAEYLKYVGEQLDSIDSDIFMVAFRQNMINGKGEMDGDVANAFLNNKASKVRAEKQKERDAQAAANEAEGKSFLEENAKKEGVVTTESGLQYIVINEGKGAKPAENDRIKVNYRGTLLNGEEFDASKEGEPATLSVRGVIKGWQEALQLMPVGSKWQLFIPGDLAYGKRGAGEKIGPNATLIFEVELVEIVK